MVRRKKIEFTLSLQRVDEDIREHLQSASISSLIEMLKERADTALSTVY